MSEQHNQMNQQHVHHAYPNYYYPYYSQAYYPTYARQYSNQPPNQQPPTQTYLPQQLAQQQQQQQQQQIPGMLPMERSYIENILRLNRGKVATVYMTFENDGRQTFTGRIEAAGRDHIILSDPNTDKRYLLLMVYLDYVTFDEEINYEYPFGSTGQSDLTTYPPR